jgi:hypothetical protein
MDIATANQLFENGTFSELYKAGFVSVKIFLYREIYLWVQKEATIKNITQYEAAKLAEAHFNKDLSTIYRALRAFTN